MKETLKKLLLRLRALLPSKLPQGVNEFEEWTDSVLYIYDMPNNRSTKFALATMIMHLGPTEGYKSKEFFGRSLMKTAATQIAYAMMQEIKEKQKQDEEAAKKVAENEPQQ